MTIALRSAEEHALDALELRLTRRGYQLVRAPAPQSLPEFLREAGPDAVAFGGPPNLLIEVLGGREPSDARSEAEHIRTLRSCLLGHPDWSLEVVYAPISSSPLPQASPMDIRRRVEQVRKFAGSEPAGALLLAWSLLEAAARALEPGRTARALTPGAMSELLIGLGHLEQGDAETLNAAGRLRNAIAHGDVSSWPPEPDQVLAILATVERLLDAADNPADTFAS